MKGLRVELFPVPVEPGVPYGMDDLQESINHWLEQNPGVDVQDVKITLSERLAVGIVIYKPER